MREISISSGEHDWPFSKGLIVESLLNASIQREPAIAIARRVEQRLLDEQRRVVSPSTLKILVTEEARAVLGAEAADTLEAQTSAFEDIVVIDGNGRIPFSKGILSRSLELAGLPIKDAYELAKEIELTLRLQGITRIEREGLEARVTAEVERHFGPSAREAYLERYQRTLELITSAEAYDVVRVGEGATFSFADTGLLDELELLCLAPGESGRHSRLTKTTD